MAKVVDAARITIRDGATWRTCGACGHLAALAPDTSTCPECKTAPAPAESSADFRRERRELVALIAASSVAAVREAHVRPAPDVLRCAALIEIAAAAATLARATAARRHLDVDSLVALVRDPVDAYAVLGRGRWLPTMTRHVPAPKHGPVRAGVLVPLVAEAARRRRAITLAGDAQASAAAAEAR